MSLFINKYVNNLTKCRDILVLFVTKFARFYFCCSCISTLVGLLATPSGRIGKHLRIQMGSDKQHSDRYKAIHARRDVENEGDNGSIGTSG